MPTQAAPLPPGPADDAAAVLAHDAAGVLAHDAAGVLAHDAAGVLAHDTALTPPLPGATAAALLDRLYWPPRADGPVRLLVVLCHGVGATGRQLARLAAAWGEALPQAAFAAPHAPFVHRTRHLHWLTAAGLRGREWYSLIDRSPAAAEAGVRVAARALDAFIDDELHRLGLGPGAVVLMGFSQGAMTALFAGLRRPVPPRAILSFSGEILAPARLPAELRNHAPVLLVHGAADRVVPAARSQAAALALQALGVPVRLVVLPAAGHAMDRAGIAAGTAFLRQLPA